MHTHGHTAFAAAVSIMLLGACDRDAGERFLGPEPAPPMPSVSASAGSGGAVILRFAAITFTLIFDAERQLLAAHMPSDVFVCAGGSAPLNVVEVQRVETPTAFGQIVAKQTADERVAIYHAASPAEAGLAASIDFFGFNSIFDGAAFCGFLTGPNRIAEGTVRRLSTFSLASFHARWTGTIQGVDGRDYHLNEVYQLNADIHDPNNPDLFSQPVAKILLRPVK